MFLAIFVTPNPYPKLLLPLPALLTWKYKTRQNGTFHTLYSHWGGKRAVFSDSWLSIWCLMWGRKARWGNKGDGCFPRWHPGVPESRLPWARCPSALRSASPHRLAGTVLVQWSSLCVPTWLFIDLQFLHRNQHFNHFVMVLSAWMHWKVFCLFFKKNKLPFFFNFYFCLKFSPIFIHLWTFASLSVPEN